MNYISALFPSILIVIWQLILNINFLLCSIAWYWWGSSISGIVHGGKCLYLSNSQCLIENLKYCKKDGLTFTHMSTHVHVTQILTNLYLSQRLQTNPLFRHFTGYRYWELRIRGSSSSWLVSAKFSKTKYNCSISNYFNDILSPPLEIF